MNNTWHAGKTLANTELDWLSSDTPESFAKMIKYPEHQQYFNNKGWLQPGAITYKFNQHGFRCEEFNQDPCIVALGCSYTVGIGLPISDTWPVLVGQSLGLQVVNLAWGGYAADSCFRLAECWLPQLNPALVVMLAPPIERVEVLKENGHMVHMPTNMPNTASDQFIVDWMLNSENSRLNSLKNKLALQQLCAGLNVPCQIYDANIYMADSREKLEYARDYMHAGPRGHQILAERILNDCTAAK
jgi:hypothetical protein